MNDCLLKSVSLLGDVIQVFLQIGINKEDHNALRLHWVNDLKAMDNITFQFTRLPFGCVPSSFILNATLMEHLQVCIKKEENKPVEEEIQDDLSVDDLTSGGVNK